MKNEGLCEDQALLIYGEISKESWLLRNTLSLNVVGGIKLRLWEALLSMAGVHSTITQIDLRISRSLRTLRVPLTNAVRISLTSRLQFEMPSHVPELLSQGLTHGTR